MVIYTNLASSEKTMTDILKFVPLSSSNADEFIKKTDECPFFVSAYSAGQLIMWSDYFNAEYAEKGGYFFIKLKIKGKTCFMFPFPVNPGNEKPLTTDRAFEEIEKYCMKNYLPLCFSLIPDEALGYLAERYRNCRISEGRNIRDYLYRAENMRTFAGRSYSGQRNHVNKFKKLFPGAYFTEYSDSLKNKCIDFFDEFEKSFEKDSRLAKRELALAEKMFFAKPLSRDRRGVCILDGKVISLCYGEKCAEMLVIHIEKALPYEGIYPFTVQSFARMFSNDVSYINREDDSGDRGLRISKNQYKPCAMISKSDISVYNELFRLSRIPEITSKRLTLSEITESDIPDYNRLCLDDERNVYWGYDYREDLHSGLYERYFFNDAADGFEKRVYMSLAVRLNGKFIGEVVLFEFDCRGSASAGVRILPEFASFGYGREAIEALCDFALYSLELERVKAYCFKENTASFKMLSALMKKTGEDEKYYYFEKSI